VPEEPITVLLVDDHPMVRQGLRDFLATQHDIEVVAEAASAATHPYYLDLLCRATLAAGVPNPVINPYGYSTKGEMLRASRNPGLLRQLAKETVSCSHPEAARMQQREQGNCGYCFPCLIRRAALAEVSWDTENPPWDALTDPRLIEETGERRGADLRAVVNGVFADRPDSDVLRNAPLPRGTRGMPCPVSVTQSRHPSSATAMLLALSTTPVWPEPPAVPGG
jgi:hypothetical protein